MITPYYEQGGVVIYHGDCRDVLPQLAVDVDVTITDPPYGQTSLEWDRRVLGWYELLPRVPLWCFGSLRFFMEEAAALAGARFHLAQDIISTDDLDVVWEKHNGSNLHADRFNRVHEQVAHFYPAELPWAAVPHMPVTTPDATARTVRRKSRPPHNGGHQETTYLSSDGGPRLMRSVLHVRSAHGYAEHPTQKPIGVIIPLVEYSTVAGGLVLDPFMGVGSTLVAAQQLGRRAIGIEGREDYCEAAVRRLAQMPLVAAEGMPA